MRVFPPTDEEITDLQLYKQFTKYTITKPDESACKVRAPVFSDGSLEHFLKFLTLFEQEMTGMNLDTKNK